jgi:hypothetical protein
VHQGPPAARPKGSPHQRAAWPQRRRTACWPETSRIWPR